MAWYNLRKKRPQDIPQDTLPLPSGEGTLSRKEIDVLEQASLLPWEPTRRGIPAISIKNLVKGPLRHSEIIGKAEELGWIEAVVSASLGGDAYYAKGKLADAIQETRAYQKRCVASEPELAEKKAQFAEQNEKLSERAAALDWQDYSGGGRQVQFKVEPSNQEAVRALLNLTERGLAIRLSRTDAPPSSADTHHYATNDPMLIAAIDRRRDAPSQQQEPSRSR